MQGEHHLPYELVRPVLDHSGEVVAVLGWKGEIAFLHRGAHSRAAQCRNLAGGDEPLRPAVRALESVRTATSPGLGRASGAGRSSARPRATDQSARAPLRSAKLQLEAASTWVPSGFPA